MIYVFYEINDFQNQYLTCFLMFEVYLDFFIDLILQFLRSPVYEL